MAAGRGVGDFYLGLNWTTGDPDKPVVMSDGTVYDKDTMYAFDEQEEKFGEKNCTYVRAGVKYQPRDLDCSRLLAVICQWRRPTCPPGYSLYPLESDGRTCYSTTTGKPPGPAASLADRCRAADNSLQRPALPWNPDLINKLKPQRGDPPVWIEGFSDGDNVWKTRGFRDHWDTDNRLPELVEDLSPRRAWFKDKSKEKTSEGFEIFKPRKLPVRLSMPAGYCAAGSDIKFYLKGTFKSPIGDISPQIILRMNNTHELFHWAWREGDPRTNTPPSYAVWARERFSNLSASLVSLVNLPAKLERDLTFNLTLTCADFAATKQFRVMMNYWDPATTGLARTSSDWDLVATLGTSLEPEEVRVVELLGGMELTYAGFTRPGCLALTASGLVVEMAGAECEEEREGLCEHQSCFTTEGQQCLFPFQYKGRNYTECTSVDVYQPWCVTATNNSRIESWGLCLPDCPSDQPVVSCLAPPPVPRFGRRNESSHPLEENYRATWFNLSFLDCGDGSPNQSHYQVTRQSRAKLYQPWIPYDPAVLTETNLSFFARDQFDHFNDVYEIRVNGSVEEYTCPLGWHFQHSKNITHRAQCRDWHWVALFDISKPCVRQYYLSPRRPFVSLSFLRSRVLSRGGNTSV